MVIIITNLEIYQQYGKKLDELLRLSNFPLAIKLVETEEEIPEGCKRPFKDLKLQNFVCQNFKIARTYGWTIAITEKDCNCKIARGIYGWDPITPESLKFANKFSVGLYSKDAETSNKWFETLHLLKCKYAGLVISPLARTKVEPDVVQIYGFPAQIMRLVQSYLYMEGGAMQFTSSGRAGSCHEGVIKTINLDLPQLVLLGNGDRVWGGAEDSEVMFSMPKNKLEIIVKGLESTHKAGLRYPIPKYMNYSPGFQAGFAKKAFKRAGGTLVKEK